jgi:molecular chaperone GrpE (heat shock protein)
VIPELDSADNLPATTAADKIDDREFHGAADAGPADQSARPDKPARDAEPSQDAEPALAGLPGAEITAAVRDLATSAERYHDRAQQRESVIDYLRSELEVLRRGERRGLLRPLLTDMCRLRNDLIRQASGLPADYDATRAAELLLSYAESIQITLEANGVVTFAPNDGEPFDPRMHRRVKGQDTTDPALAGRIADVRRDGYLDIEANSPLTPAEVAVFAIPRGEQ